MTLNDKHAEASLLFTRPSAPLAAVDAIALSSRLNTMGFPVTRIDSMPGDFIRLACDSVQILVAGFDRPFPMEHFLAAQSPRRDEAQGKEILSLLAAHGSSLTVLVLDPADTQTKTGFATKVKICRETVDLLLAATSPDLVFWSNEDRLDTAAEAESVLEVAAAEPDTGQFAPSRISTVVVPHQTLCPEVRMSPRRSDGIDKGRIEYLTDDIAIRPKKPTIPPHRTERPTNLCADPRPVFADTEADPRGLRSFLALDDSSEPRRIADTATGRASLYLMSATIAVFALPVGASMLTYNALSGGSFRVTSHVMALTGMFLALAAAGMPNPAAALSIGF